MEEQESTKLFWERHLKGIVVSEIAFAVFSKIGLCLSTENFGGLIHVIFSFTLAFNQSCDRIPHQCLTEVGHSVSILLLSMSPRFAGYRLSFVSVCAALLLLVCPALCEPKFFSARNVEGDSLNRIKVGSKAYVKQLCIPRKPKSYEINSVGS